MISQNTRLIHSIVLCHIPVPTDGFITTTGHGQRPAGSNPLEYTKNTRSCIMTSTGDDRLLYKRSTRVLGLRSTGVGICYSDPGRDLPTVRIIAPSSPMASVWPNTTAQWISAGYIVTGHSLIERVTIFLYLTVQEHNWFILVIYFKST